MGSLDLLRARLVVQTGIKAQAQLAGLWQQRGDLIWWQTELGAVAANLVLHSGYQVESVQVQRLAALMKWQQRPAGWLVWPDQAAEYLQPVLLTNGFYHSENIKLLSAAAENLSIKKFSKNIFISHRPENIIQLLGINQQHLFSEFLVNCHAIPNSFAHVVAEAFLAQKSTEPPAINLDGAPVFSSWAVYQAGKPVASITACLLKDKSQLIGGLLWLGTLAEWRRMGFARQLAAHACDWLLTNGVNFLYVQSSRAAIQLYLDLGFQENGNLELWNWWP